MKFIQNVSLRDIVNGDHMPADTLIQIVDPGMEFPQPAYPFRNVYQFYFLDVERDDPFDLCVMFTMEQAREIVHILRHTRGSIIVHCVAGICRSGAIAEVGVMMGYTDTGAHRQPNLLVKHSLMKVLGWTYEEDEPFSENGRHFFYDAQNNKVFYNEITTN